MSAPRKWPLFNDSATCPKCAHSEIGASWRARGNAAYTDRLNVFDTEQGDWIQRYCKRCQFGWPEEPLDAPDRQAC